MLKRFLQDDEGATAMIFALAMPLFIGGIALAVELGHWHQKKSKLQDMADNAALAAAHEVMLLGETANYVFAGKGHALENGHDFNSGSVDVISPPTVGEFAGKNAVEVTVNKKQELYFTKYFGQKSLTLETKATAMIIDGVPACVLSLSPDAGPALALGGSANVDVRGCGVHTNSSAANSVEIGNNNSFMADCLSTVGGISAGNGLNLGCEDGAQDYSRTVRDPYRNTTIPDNVSSLSCASIQRQGQNRYISLNGASSGRVCSPVTAGGLIEFLDPGTYYFDGEDLTTNSSNSLIFGEGVTLVFMNGATYNGTNGGRINLVANDEGPFAGLALFFDPLTTTDSFLRINGNQNSLIEGVIYAPTMNVQFNGGANQNSRCTHLIANTVDLRGNSGFTNTACDELGARQIGGESGVALVQ